jgi:hypothetical protein
MGKSIKHIYIYRRMTRLNSCIKPMKKGFCTLYFPWEAPCLNIGLSATVLILRVYFYRIESY